MPQDRSLLDEPVSFHLRPPLPDFEDRFHHAVDVTLGVAPLRDCQANQLHGSGRLLASLTIGLLVAVPMLAAVIVPIEMLYVRDLVGHEVKPLGEESG